MNRQAGAVMHCHHDNDDNDDDDDDWWQWVWHMGRVDDWVRDPGIDAREMRDWISAGGRPGQLDSLICMKGREEGRCRQNRVEYENTKSTTRLVCY